VCGFKEWVSAAFLDTTTSHRITFRSAELCPPPEFEVTDVDILVNPELAELFRGNMLLLEKEAPKVSHPYTASQVASDWQAVNRGSAGWDQEWMSACSWDGMGLAKR
jgi:hypothetical protein